MPLPTLVRSPSQPKEYGAEGQLCPRAKVQLSVVGNGITCPAPHWSSQGRLLWLEGLGGCWLRKEPAVSNPELSLADLCRELGSEQSGCVLEVSVQHLC